MNAIRARILLGTTAVASVVLLAWSSSRVDPVDAPGLAPSAAFDSASVEEAEAPDEVTERDDVSAILARQAWASAREHAGDVGVIARKYAGFDRHQLCNALRLLTPVLDAESHRLIDERWKSGRFEEYFVVQGQQSPTSASWNPDEIGSYPITGHQFAPAGGGNIVRRTELSAREYPDHEALRRETAWLRWTIGPGCWLGPEPGSVLAREVHQSAF